MNEKMVKSKLNEINLMPQEKLAEEPVGKFLSWAESAGKVIVVLTEALVLMVFFARFSIDAQILDLKQEMTAKAQLLQSLKGFEQEFNGLQTKLATTASASAKLYSPDPILALIEKNIPADIFLQDAQISPKKIILQGSSQSYGSISAFWFSLKNQGSLFENVDLISLGRQETSAQEQAAALDISFTLQINPKSEAK